jgi:hypothetical protein
MIACRRSGADFWAGPSPLPPRESSSLPDARRFEARLAEWIDDDRWTAREVLLCDGAATAAILGLLGFAEKARACLDAATVPDWLDRARWRLGEAIRTQPALLDAPWPEPVDRRWQGVRAMLRSTEDPSVLLGSPHWLLAEGRGRLTTRLVENGRLGNARRLAGVLDNAARRDDARPYWLVDERDTEGLLALGDYLASSTPRLGRYEALEALERICRGLEGDGEGASR